MNNLPPEDNHLFGMVKLISASYLKIRLHHLARETTMSVTDTFVRGNHILENGKIVGSAIGKYQFRA